MAKKEPKHQRRYRIAWESYRDPDTPKECLLDIERELDELQNEFGCDEFIEFKSTLDDYNKFWGRKMNEKREKGEDIC